MRFAAVGDVLPHVSVKLSAQRYDERDESGASKNHEGWDALFAAVAGELAAADLAFANLETPVSKSGDGGGREFVFNAPEAMLAGLRQAGFDVVGFSNNHVYDQGRRGFAETLSALDAAGLPYVGAGSSRAQAFAGVRLEKDGVRLALLGASQFFNVKEGETADAAAPQAAKIGDGAELEAAVRAARAEVDLVIVSLHWGEEYQAAPRPSEVELAHRLFEAGADVILGTHPHVLQPLEVYRTLDGRDCLVVYSLGNFISNQSRHYAHGVSREKDGDTRDGAVLRFTIVKKDFGAAGTRAELAEVSYVPTWTENDYLSRRGKALPDIRVVPMLAAIQSAQAQLASLESEAARPEPARAGDWRRDVIAVRKRLELLERRHALVEGRLGPSWCSCRP